MDEHSKLRRFQFSLAALFALVTVVCAFVAHPRFMLSWIALFLAVILAGTLFVVLIFLPLKLLSSGLPDEREDAEHRQCEAASERVGPL